MLGRSDSYEGAYSDCTAFALTLSLMAVYVPIKNKIETGKKLNKNRSGAKMNSM